MRLDRNLIFDTVKAALAEDVGTGDITTLATIPAQNRSTARFVAKADGVVCGLGVAEAAFAIIDKATVFTPLISDGDRVKKGDVIATVSGFSASLLTAERVALNFLQHMSGIATYTSECAKQLEGTGACVVDTRKTTPGLRVFEKYAVTAGGGRNHRFNLADGILIKDNHIAAAGSIAAAVNAAREYAPHTLRVEVEVENLDMVKQALAAKADIIMLDNMTDSEMKAAVELIAGRAITEASGNMDARNLAEVAATGVDIISIGALTHSVKALDISLKFDKQR